MKRRIVYENGSRNRHMPKPNGPNADFVSGWLEQLGLSGYLQAFLDNDIDAGNLAHLTSTDLVELGVTSVGHRRRPRRASNDAPAQETPSARLSAFKRDQCLKLGRLQLKPEALRSSLCKTRAP